MTLQQIIENYEKKSWLRLCTLNGISKWDLIDYINEPVYSSRYFMRSEFKIATRNCLKCGTRLNLTMYKGNFIACTNCDCANDGTHLMTKDKLNCILTDDQATKAIQSVNREKCKGLSNTIEYWCDKGYTIEQAKEKVSSIQKERSAKSPVSKKGVRGYSVRTIEYWMKKGYTFEESESKIKLVQTTNGLKFYINKYGSAGEELFKKRIEQWLNAPGNKAMTANRSKKSQELFEHLEVGLYGPNEKTIRGKQKVHRVDYLHNNKIIEYYGDYWHGNPKIYKPEDMIRKKKVKDVWDHDQRKIQDLKNNGYSVLIIWENDYINDPAAIIQQCKDFIK